MTGGVWTIAMTVIQSIATIWLSIFTYFTDFATPLHEEMKTMKKRIKHETASGMKLRPRNKRKGQTSSPTERNNPVSQAASVVDTHKDTISSH